MSALIAGIFFLNAGITLTAFVVFQNRADHRLKELEERHFSLMLDLARKQGRIIADLTILEGKNATR